jgi:hypothetical protein
MKIYSLEETDWNQQLLVHLQMHGCAGMEFHWPRAVSGSSCGDVLAKTRRALAEHGYAHQWTLVSHETLQPANRVTRHQGIWKPLGVDLKGLPSESIGEWLVEYEEGIRFFGAALQDALGDASLLAIWRQMKSSWLVLSMRPMSVATLRSWFRQGWGSTGALPPSDLLNMARSEDLILMRCLETTPTSCIYLALGAAATIESQIVSLRAFH